MFGYALVGSNDIGKAMAFYDELLGSVGAKGVFEHPNGGRVYGTAPDKPFFGVVAPYDGNPATAGNGSMLSMALGSREQVDGLHALAVSLGGSDEGAPGPRGPDGAFYAAYFRDPDGNKFCAFNTGG